MNAPAPVDLRTATKEELQGIAGVGEVLAGKIFQQRRRWCCLEDVKKVKGISEAKFARMLGDRHYWSREPLPLAPVDHNRPVNREPEGCSSGSDESDEPRGDSDSDLEDSELDLEDSDRCSNAQDEEADDLSDRFKTATALGPRDDGLMSPEPPAGRSNSTAPGLLQATAKAAVSGVGALASTAFTVSRAAGRAVNNIISMRYSSAKPEPPRPVRIGLNSPHTNASNNIAPEERRKARRAVLRCRGGNWLLEQADDPASSHLFEENEFEREARARLVDQLGSERQLRRLFRQEGLERLMCVNYKEMSNSCDEIERWLQRSHRYDGHEWELLLPSWERPVVWMWAADGTARTSHVVRESLLPLRLQPGGQMLLHKYVKRLKLQMSTTVATRRVRLEFEPDRFAADGSNMTDGCGRMHPETMLRHRVDYLLKTRANQAIWPEMLRGNPFMQIRVDGRIKGGVIPDPNVSQGVLKVTDSMKKFDSGSPDSGMVEVCSVGFAKVRREVSLSLHLLYVLEARGWMAEDILEVWQENLDGSLQNALEPAEDGLPKNSYDDLQKMLSGGMKIGEDPFLTHKIYEQHIKELEGASAYLRDLKKDKQKKKQFQLHLRPEQAGYFFIAWDASGQLHDEQCYLHCDGKWKHGRVALLRNPSYRSYDVVVLDCVVPAAAVVEYYHDWQYLPTETIILSANMKNATSLAGRQSGGDQDGDKSIIITDEEIVRLISENPKPRQANGLAEHLKNGESRVSCQMSPQEVNSQLAFWAKTMSTSCHQIGINTNHLLKLWEAYGVDSEQADQAANLCERQVDRPWQAQKPAHAMWPTPRSSCLRFKLRDHLERRIKDIKDKRHTAILRATGDSDVLALIKREAGHLQEVEGRVERCIQDFNSDVAESCRAQDNLTEIMRDSIMPIHSQIFRQQFSAVVQDLAALAAYKLTMSRVRKNLTGPYSESNPLTGCTFVYRIALDNLLQLKAKARIQDS